MLIEFWGTRGSIAKPGPGTVRYGGNTSCTTVRLNDGTRLILDCGTGAHSLGMALLAQKERPIRGHLLIGHTHWDHIQGIPFFAPLFIPGNEFDIYAPQGLRAQVRDTLAGQMQYTYFPVSLEQLGATIRYHDLTEGTFQLGSALISTHYLNHPAVTLAYRIQADGVTLIYATDHEPHERPVAGPSQAGRGRQRLLHPEDRRHAEFMADADLLVHDAQYTASEYPTKVGWGHSTIDYVVDVGLAAGVKSLALFHHDPMRTDDDLDNLVGTAREWVDEANSHLQVFAAAEGQRIELVRDIGDAKPRIPELRRTGRPPRTDAANRIVLVAPADPAIVRALDDMLSPEGFRIVTAADGETAFNVTVAEPPAMLLLGRRGPGWDGIEMVRRLRHHDGKVRDIPIVLVAGVEDAADTKAAFEAGATDWLTRPCSPAFIQARIRSWLLRTRARWVKPPLAPDEDDRAADVARLGLLDTPPEERFDRLARIAARTMGAQFAYISVMDHERQWFKAAVGPPRPQEGPRDVSMCGYAVLGNDVLIVPDAACDPRFGDNPSFHDDLHLRFYAGMPLRAPSGRTIGALCVYDPRPRQPIEEDLAAFRDLATLIEKEMVAAAATGTGTGTAAAQPSTGAATGARVSAAAE